MPDEAESPIFFRGWAVHQHRIEKIPEGGKNPKVFI